MVTLKRSEISGVAAYTTTSSKLCNKLQFVDPSSLDLLVVALVVIVRMPVLAVLRAEQPLASAQAIAANRAN
jgi:hypothetical protein